MSKFILNFKNFKSNLKLEICGSKSISQRALVINFLNSSKKKIINLSNSDDTKTLCHILNDLKNSLNVKDGGTTLRFLLSVLSLRKGAFFINGSTSLKKRPLKQLIVNLKKMGVLFKFQKQDYQIPLHIIGGNLKSKELIIDSNETSQFASSLALIAPYVHGGLKLIFKDGIVSPSYFNMTIQMMKICGAKIFCSKNFLLIKDGGYQKDYDKIESDWTSLSYIYEIIAFSNNSSIICSKFYKNSLQPDSKQIYFFNLLGVKTCFDNGKIILKKNKNLPLPKFIQWDVLDTPDLTLSYIVSCLGLGINLKLTGIQTLMYKESNRLKVMKKELEKFNVKVVLTENSFFMDSSSRKFKRQFINTYFDHRIALAFSPLVLLTKELVFDDFNVVSKSYPAFWNDLEKIGIKIRSED